MTRHFYCFKRDCLEDPESLQSRAKSSRPFFCPFEHSFIFLDIFKTSKLFSTSFADPSETQSVFLEYRLGDRNANVWPLSRRNLWSGSDKHFWRFKITLTCVFKDDRKSSIAIDSPHPVAIESRQAIMMVQKVIFKKASIIEVFNHQLPSTSFINC